MQFKNTDLVLALAVSVLNIVCILVPIELSWLRIMLALPLVFVLPGYMLTEMLFYQRKMATSHRLLLAVSLSIVIVIIGGLLLDILSPGLQSVSWVMYLSLETVAGVLVVALRRGGVARPAIKMRVFHVYEYFLFVLVLGGILFALQYAREGMAQQPHPPFTQFWMLQAGENSCTVRLGMHSFEPGAVPYRVELTANDAPVPTQFPSVLNAGEQVERTIGLPNLRGDTLDVRARLYRLDRQGEVYRAVNIVLHRVATRCTST